MVYVYGEESMIVEFTFGSSSLFVNKHNDVTDLMNCHGFAYMNCHQIDLFSVISQPHRAAA